MIFGRRTSNARERKRREKERKTFSGSQVIITPGLDPPLKL